MKSKKLVKNKNAVTSKQLGDNDLQAKEDWTEFHPQVMMEQALEGEQLCKDLEFYIAFTDERFNKDEDWNSIVSKVNGLIVLYRDNVHGIQQWWKYSHLDE